MKIENLAKYEIDKRAESIKQKPDSLAAKLADAAFDLLKNEEFTSNPHKFLANPVNFKSLTPFHKAVITTVYHISFRHPIK